MGCLNINITRVESSPLVDIIRIGEGLQTEAYIAIQPPSILVRDVTPKVITSIENITPKMAITIGLICSINGTAILKFEKDKLIWNSKEDNQIGVIKYNLLTASAGWILEEIEELL